MTIIIDTLSFCHYPGFFGYLLGLFQYLPTGLIIGIFFWSIACRDPFFLSLGLTMKITWWNGLLFKYFIIPFLIPSSVVIVPTLCENYVPTFLTYVISIFFPNGNSNMIQGSEFPNIDVLQSGSYIGFVMFFYLFWHYPLGWTPGLGLLGLSFVPWSFLSTGSGTFWAIAVSVYIGIIFGASGLFISYYIYYSCIYGGLQKSKTQKCCFKYWCGSSSNSQDIDSEDEEPTTNTKEENGKKWKSLFLYQ